MFHNSSPRPIVRNQSYQSAPPHFEDPLAAPRPRKLIKNLTANMAQSLDQRPFADRSVSPYNPMPGFAVNSKDRAASPLPPPLQGSEWSPWNVSASSLQPRSSQRTDLTSAFNNMSFTNYASPIECANPSNPSLTAPIPNAQTLLAAFPSIQNPSFDIVKKFIWCRDSLFLVDRLNQASSTSSETPLGPVHIEDPHLLQLMHVAVPTLLSISSPLPMPNPMPGYVAEAIYLRATLASSGAWPDYIPLNPRAAFRDFELAAKGGYPPAWFRLGRDYEAVGDEKHAKNCFERGVKHNVESCLYRMGMAHLMGQLGLPARPDIALPLLERAATLATIQVAQPAYVYGLLLLNEFTHVSVPPHYLSAVIPPGSTPAAEARKHLERAAYLHFTPAQYKLGHAYEFAEAPFPFDALASVQYYSLASQQGEIEADMALSKWFLCGAEGAFEKDEGLAYTFAEKAARKGLASAEFAMGYYAEVGVGGPQNVESARKWYNRAMEHGNTNASERLAALSQPAPLSLSRKEHDNLTETTLVRKRTQAKQRSEADPGHKKTTSQNQGQKIIEGVRSTSLAASTNDIHADRRVSMRPQLPRIPSTGSLLINTQPSISEYFPAMQNSPIQMAQPLDSLPPGQQGSFTGNASLAQRTRYSLSDPGPESRLPPSIIQTPPVDRPGPGSDIGPTGRPYGGTSTPDLTEPPRPNPGKKPQTFQEMGFQSQKLQDKECIIM